MPTGLSIPLSLASARAAALTHTIRPHRRPAQAWVRTATLPFGLIQIPSRSARAATGHKAEKRARAITGKRYELKVIHPSSDKRWKERAAMERGRRDGRRRRGSRRRARLPPG